MIQWWNSLTALQQILACCAVPATIVLVIQTILLIVGISGGDGGDTELEIEAMKALSLWVKYYDESGITEFSFTEFTSMLKDMDTEATLDILEDAGFPVKDMGISMDNDAMLDVIDQIAKEPDRKITGNGPRLHEYLQELSREAFREEGLVTVGEAWGADVERAKLFSRLDGTELSMVFQFEPTSS